MCSALGNAGWKPAPQKGVCHLFLCASAPLRENVPMPLAAFPKCYLNALCAERSMTAEGWIERAARDLDVDGLEFYWGFTPADAAGQKRLRALAASYELEIPMMCYSPD